MLRNDPDAFISELNALANNLVFHTKTFKIGGHKVTFKSCSSAFLQNSLFSLRSPEVDFHGQPDYEILILDRKELPESKLKSLNYGFYRDKDYRLEIIFGDNTIHIQDKEARRSFYVFRDVGQVPKDDGSISRQLLSPAYSTLGYVVFHGAVVEFENMGFLFLGPGGVGKSTIVARLILEGCFTIGDDFFVCHVDNPLKAIAISRSLKMAPQNQLMGEFSAKYRPWFDNGKKLIFDIMDSTKDSIDINRVILPTLEHVEGFQAATSDRLLHKTLPTSVLLNLEPSKVIKHIETFFLDLPRHETSSKSINKHLLQRISCE